LTSNALIQRQKPAYRPRKSVMVRSAAFYVKSYRLNFAGASTISETFFHADKNMEIYVGYHR
jgi:hypothetical protein